jgi:hypothetical protein
MIIYIRIYTTRHRQVEGKQERTSKQKYTRLVLENVVHGRSIETDSQQLACLLYSRLFIGVEACRAHHALHTYRSTGA